jgi:hypothetical protein
MAAVKATFVILSNQIRTHPRLLRGRLLPGAVDLFTAGVALAILYARSDNLALCVGIHSLANKPMLLVADCFDLPNNLLFVTVTCLVLAALWRRDKIR